MRVDYRAGTIELVQGDITEQTVDAVVNAANSRLAGGGGVDGAIHRRGGPAIMADTRLRYPGGCPTGSAVISVAGQLAARYVIHAVGPIYRDGRSGEAELLAGAYRRSFELAAEHDCASIALPALSTGAYGYPLAAASVVALDQARRSLERTVIVKQIRFVLFGAEAFATFVQTLERERNE